MSDNKSNTNASGSSSDQKTGWNGKSYTTTDTGTDAQGNHLCTRDYSGSGGSAQSVHYSNNDGSYGYNNPDGSRYHQDASGDSVFVPASASKK